jgi:hypothetical protein
MSIDVSEEHIAFIFTVEDYAEQEHTGFLLGLFFDHDGKGDMFLRNVD